jgi:hypothetical protein
MSNHYHLVLRTRPNLAVGWSNTEVAVRWFRLFPKHHDSKCAATSLPEEDIATLLCCPDRIEVLRKRLSSLSWFMGQLAEFIARAANKEDKVSGRFWESRFKCQALLDEAAIAACMVYVDLNPIRAGIVTTPEESSFTSIQERIRAWKNEVIAKNIDDTGTTSLENTAPVPKIKGEFPDPVLEKSVSTLNLPAGLWLCPISSEPQRQGILPMTESEYFDLVDKSGRAIRSDKRGAIAPDLPAILLRIGAKQEAWQDTISHFESRFYLASGVLSNLRNFAKQIGNKWLKGISVARIAFAG